MSTELSKEMSNTEMIIHNFTETELETLKKTIAKGTTNEQFALFVATCKRSKLDPFLNQIHCIVYVGQQGPVMSIQFPVEGYVADAKRNPDYRGYRAAVVRENDHFEADLSQATYEHKLVGLVRGKTLGAYCIVYREGKPDILVVVTVDQLEKHILKSKNKDTIDTWYDDFVIKHAVKRAFRIQFGIDFADEDDGGGQPVGSQDPYERKVIDPADVTVDETPPTTKPESKKKADPPPVVPVDETADRKAVNASIKAKLKELGITTDEAIGAYMSEHMTVAGEKPTLDERRDLLKFIEAEVAKKQAAANDDLPD